MIKKYRAIFISDVHLGTRDCKAEELNNFLKHNSCETLYLVGDIIDGWRIQQNKWTWKKSHTKVVRRILGMMKSRTKVIFVPGNHDEFLRILPHEAGFDLIKIVNQTDHVGIDQTKRLVTECFG
jgi:UDP-2,3-diacylglucosamine pyrophosphatase LpxH